MRTDIKRKTCTSNYSQKIHCGNITAVNCTQKGGVHCKKCCNNLALNGIVCRCHNTNFSKNRTIKKNKKMKKLNKKKTEISILGKIRRMVENVPMESLEKKSVLPLKNNVFCKNAMNFMTTMPAENYEMTTEKIELSAEDVKISQLKKELKLCKKALKKLESHEPILIK